MEHTPQTLSWHTPEYEHYERSTDWFWAVGIIAAAFMLISILFGNLLFTILIVVATGALILQVLRKPALISYQITDRGVIVDTLLHPYSELTSFWVTEQHESSYNPKLLIRRTEVFAPYLVILLGDDIDPDDVRVLMLVHLNEEHIHEPFSERLMGILGF